MSIEAGIIQSLLQTLFAALEGDVTFAQGDKSLMSKDIFEIQDFLNSLDSSEAASLDIATTAGKAKYFAYMALDDAEIDTVLDQLDGPAFALEKGDAMCLVYQGKPKKLPDLLTDAIPVPGFGGWDLTIPSKTKIVTQAMAEGLVDMGPPEEESSAETEEESSAEPAEGEVEAFEPVKTGALEQVSYIPDEVLDHSIKFSVGKSRQDKVWLPTTATVQQFLTMFTKHPEGVKDGTSFIQGIAVGNDRKTNAISALSIVGMDIDCGLSFDEVVARASKYDLAFVAYTTHSNMKTDSEILQSSYLRWAKKVGHDAPPTDALMADYLMEVRSWLPAVANSVKVLSTVQTREGMCYSIKHSAMEKIRIIFFLAKPFVVTEYAAKGLPQSEIIQIWKRKLLGLAKLLDGLPIDESCTDPSRLFYFPRHPKGMPHRAMCGGQNLLDFDIIPEINPRGREDADVVTERFERAAEVMTGVGGTIFYNEFNIKGWAAQGQTKTWRAADAFRERAAPGVIRNDKGTDKIEIKCPFDSEHGNAGDSEDVACYVVSAHADGGTNPFAFGCQHNSCKGKDRLEFLCAALEQEMIPLESLTADCYHAVTVEEQEIFIDKDAKTKELSAEAREITTDIDNIDTGRITQLIEEMVTYDLTAVQIELIFKALCGTGGITLKAVREQYKAAASDGPTDHKEQQRKFEKAQRGVHKHLNIDLGQVERLLQDGKIGHHEVKQVLINKIGQKNAGGNETLFIYGDDAFKVDCNPISNDLNLNKLTWEHLQNYLEQYIILYQSGGDGNQKSIPIPDRILKEIIAMRPHMKKLTAFTALPYYTKSGILVTKPGFNNESGYYLNLKHPIDLSKVPVKPTPEEIAKARDYLLKDVFGEFPFDDGPDSETGGNGSRAHFLAMMLQPLVRPLISGPTPIYLVSKPTAGTGGSLLVQSALVTSYNMDSAGSGSESRSEEEQRKKITAAFLSGQPFYWVDNVNIELSGASLCNLATASTWEDRELGRSRTISFPNNMQVVLSGNNPRGTYEVMRRCVPIRLDAKRDPRKRKSFKINSLLDHVKGDRQNLVSAMLTMVNAWVAEGKPRFKERNLISFENWAQVMGGIMEVCGVEGFLGNLELTQKFADDESRAWESFAYAWLNPELERDKVRQGLGMPLSAHDVAGIYASMDDQPNLGFKMQGDEDVRKITPRIANALSLKAGAPITVIIGEIEKTVCIKREKDPKTAKVIFKLVEMEE